MADEPFISKNTWTVERPHILVVACSDGRYQKALDEFLRQDLGITDYDRMYIPGGPGALASSSLSFFRGDQFRQDTAFLIERHGIEHIVLVFHGPSLDGGPLEATCADYDRRMPYAKSAAIHEQHEKDLVEVLRGMRRANPAMTIRIYRAEVRSDYRVQFVALAEPVEPYSLL